ncbi:hypothetical protein E4P42_04650 [Mycobacterium sp. PS03-16]|uniref:hypothetical protein n=1 Tax=Mycobacterium sp. PS03-16 TaxID=2559611 RepID=UPI0010741B90|nr:hypothetical protein [Mycobacterium sp. PS03-16]TFV60239.1 hypothetical protein E4P42_04650 [Mycobacterium sp. PS03-16]
MIYDFAQTSLSSLSAKFGELAEQFSILAEALRVGSPVLAAQVSELQTDAVALATSIGGAASGIPASGTAKGALETARLTFGNAGAALSSGTTDPNMPPMLGLIPRFNGLFGDAAKPTDGAEVTNCRLLLEEIRDMITEVLGDIESVTDIEVGPSFSLRGIRGGVDNLTAYPMLVSDTDGAPATSGGAPGTVAAQRLVDTAMRQTLGRLPKYTDSKAFLAALNQSFEIKAVDGQTMVSWRARSYVGQTELGGGVTGFQASLYARAREALAASLPLLQSLKPLRPDADVEEMAAARSIVQTQFNALVDELGIEGGPRIIRVDEFFNLLLRQEVFGLDNRRVPGGMLGYLGDVYGLRRELVNTIDEERAFSDFLLVRDYINTVEQSWTTFRDSQFGRDLGTRLVLLSNALQVVAESVDEVEAAMDSVFVGPAERSVTAFRIGKGRRMLVSELLSWIRSFTTGEAPQLAQDGGRRGVGAIIGTARQLADLTDALIDALADQSMPAGLRHPRVRQPLTETRGYLSRVAELAGQVHRA